MRLIGTLSSEQDAKRFIRYLQKENIMTTCEPFLQSPDNYISYQIWVHEEDRLDDAKQALESFLKTPEDSRFEVPLEEVLAEEQEEETSDEPKEEPAMARRWFYFTKAVILFCVAIFLVNTYQEMPLLERGVPEVMFAFTPVQTSCLYDLPAFFERLAQTLQDFASSSSPPQAPLPADIRAELASLQDVSYWRGFADWILLKLRFGSASEAEGPLWIKIRQGEIWRLVSPCVLHGGLLHILFNMIWVWILCRPVEQRIGLLRTALLSLLVGAGSNTAQYLMGGPFFIGYSGIVMGLAGFIAARQKIAPWEGYPIQRSTLLFLLLFVLAMFALQLVAFCLRLFSEVEFPLNIANTAHLSGLAFGYLLGKWRFFAWRVRR